MRSGKVFAMAMCLLAVCEVRTSANKQRILTRKSEGHGGNMKSMVNSNESRTEAGTQEEFNNKASDYELAYIMNACNLTQPTPTKNLREFNVSGSIPLTAGDHNDCYIHCPSANMANIFDKNGNMITSGIDQWLSEVKEDPMKIHSLDECLPPQTGIISNECQLAYDRLSCVIKTVTDRNFFNNTAEMGSSPGSCQLRKRRNPGN